MMTTLDINLLHELQQRYPEIPTDIVTSHMKQHKNDREKCIEVLANESPRYLYDASPPQDHIVSRLHDITINQAESRQRSDSTSSSLSNASSCSSSSNFGWPPNNPVHMYPNQGTHGNVVTQPAPVMPSDFDPFIQQSAPNSAGHIHNINCNAYGGFEGQAAQVTPDQSPGSSSPCQRRQVQVVHIRTPGRMPSQSGTSPTNQQQQYVYKIQFGTPAPPRTEFRSPPQVSSQWLPSSSNQGNQGHFQSPSSYTLSSAQGHSGYGGPIQQPNQYNTAPRSQQHSSQATIYLQGPNNRLSDPTSVSGNPFNTPERTLSTPGSRFNSPLTSSHSETNFGSIHQPSNFHRSQSAYNASQNSSHFVPGQPLYVEIEGAGPQERASPTSRYYGNEVNVPPVNKYGGAAGGGVPANPQNISTYVGRLYSAGVPSSTSGTSSQSAVGAPMFMMHYPRMPDTCMVPGHPTGPVRAESLDNEPVNPEYNFSRPPPILTPSSSHSSLSSESSQKEGQRPRSGSLQEEAAYTEALLVYQRQRLEKLQQDLHAENKQLHKLRTQVEDLDRNMLDQRSRTSNHNQPSLEDIWKLRDENIKLQTNIQLMTKEIDMFNNGQTPLGVWDPREQQNFYKELDPGQRGSIFSRPVQETPERESPPPPVPPRPHHVPPAPPPQPPTGSGDSEGDGEQWNCSACTLLNHPALNKCECCEMPRISVPNPIGRVPHSHSNSELCYCHDH